MRVRAVGPGDALFASVASVVAVIADVVFAVAVAASVAVVSARHTAAYCVELH